MPKELCKFFKGPEFILISIITWHRNIKPEVLAVFDELFQFFFQIQTKYKDYPMLINCIFNFYCKSYFN